MPSFTNYPIFIAESMNPFIVSIAFKCDRCGKISKTLFHICDEEVVELPIKENFFVKTKRIFLVQKTQGQEG